MLVVIEHAAFPERSEVIKLAGVLAKAFREAMPKEPWPLCGFYSCA
jgi:hypothetical protein